MRYIIKIQVYFRVHSHNRWYFLFVKGTSSRCSKIKIHTYLNYNWRIKSFVEVMLDVGLLFKNIRIIYTRTGLSLWEVAELVILTNISSSH